MHFWINKPAGRYYGFSGRRYPATPLPKTRSGQCRRNGDLRQMVTPVRLQNTNNASVAAGPSNINAYRPVRPMIRNSNENRNISTNEENSVQHTQLNNTSNNVTNAGNNQLILSNNNTNGTDRSLLDFSEISDAELASYRLRCGVWITFVLATGFVAAAKFCFGHQGPGLEILVFCGLLTLLLSACLYSILCRRTHNTHQEHHIPNNYIVSLTRSRSAANENVQSVPVVRQNPPPPYHIAILIPPHNALDEAPPPSYDKIIR